MFTQRKGKALLDVSLRENNINTNLIIESKRKHEENLNPSRSCRIIFQAEKNDFIVLKKSM